MSKPDSHSLICAWPSDTQRCDYALFEAKRGYARSGGGTKVPRQLRIATPPAVKAILAISSGFVSAAQANEGYASSSLCTLRARSSMMLRRGPPSTILDRGVLPRTTRLVS